jgi:ABC-type methionine transport system permease subunit
MTSNELLAFAAIAGFIAGSGISALVFLVGYIAYHEGITEGIKRGYAK